MNILYIAPYRLSNSIGYESLNLLYNLHDMGYNIVSRPIFDGSPTIKDQHLIDPLKKIENNKIETFDILFQHTPIQQATYTSKIKQHIYWPITQNIMPSDDQQEKYRIYSKYVKILYTNDNDKVLLSNIGISPISKLNYNISNKFEQINHGNFNLGIYNRYNKYYTLVDQSMNYTIKYLIINFVKTFSTSNNCLLLFVSNIGQNILDQYNQYIKEIYTKFNIKYNINKIVIIPIDFNCQNILSMHRTGDIFISIKNDIQTMFAIRMKKDVVSYGSSPTITWPEHNIHKNGIIEYSNNIDLNSFCDYSNIHNNTKEVIESYA